MCKRRSIDMAKIKTIISTWKLMERSNAAQEIIVAEPMEIEHVVLGEYLAIRPIGDNIIN
jgi:hypothetical protein